MKVLKLPSASAPCITCDDNGTYVIELLNIEWDDICNTLKPELGS